MEKDFNTQDTVAGSELSVTPKSNGESSSNMTEEQKIICDKVLEAVNDAVTQEKIEKDNNLFSRINDGLNRLKRHLKEYPFKTIFSTAFKDPRFYKFYKLFMLDQDRKIREYAFESFQKVLIIDEEVAIEAKKEKVHIILSYSLGRDCKSPTLVDERTQILKCIQVWILNYPKSFPFILAQSLISICKNFEDNLRK